MDVIEAYDSCLCFLARLRPKTIGRAALGVLSLYDRGDREAGTAAAYSRALDDYVRMTTLPCEGSTGAVSLEVTGPN